MKELRTETEEEMVTVQ